VAKKKRSKDSSELVGFLSVGLDSDDEHKRVTRAEHFVIVGGSEETHEHMQDTAIRFNESLDKKGKSLSETSLREALELLARAMEG
jgi:hypothetical protein